ncbi:hypothetical protein ACH4TP_38160 [Streptomyces sp. NPDC021012]|uniref:hypothetical protein n=1 Tax=Streptomyces sp. NPDC021012 TaxID=3365107 RepID=UPI0037BA7E96
MPSYQFTGEQLTDIMNRLRPYLPAKLTTVTPGTYNMRYTFTPFTGLEPEPTEPDRYWEDPKLAYKHLDEEAGRPAADKTEHQLRNLAREILSDIYQQARIEWKNARHVAELKTTVRDAGDLWKAHNQAERAVEAAFAYLRDPAAAKEWPSAVSRLVDTHDTYLTAAIAFDERAQEIAEVHDRNMHEEMLGYDEALKAAGFPEAKDWPICSTDEYGTDYQGEYRKYTAAGKAQRLIKQQEAHVAKVNRLTGQPTA